MTLACFSARRARRIQAANDERLLIHIAVGGVDQQVDGVARRQPQLVGQRPAHKQATPVVGGEVVAADHSVAEGRVRGRRRVNAQDAHARGRIAGDYDPGRVQARRGYLDFRPGGNLRRQGVGILDQVFPGQTGFVFVI